MEENQIRLAKEHVIEIICYLKKCYGALLEPFYYYHDA